MGYNVKKAASKAAGNVDKSGKTEAIIDHSNNPGYVWSESTKAAAQGPKYFNGGVGGNRSAKTDATDNYNDLLDNPGNNAYKPLDNYVYMSKSTPSWQKNSKPMTDQGIYKAPTGVSTEQSSADAKMSTALNRRFDILRGKTEQESNQQLQMANDSLSRNAAAHGRLGSGSLQRQGLLQQGQIDKQKQSALSDVEAQRETGQAALDQAAQQRAFQTSERQGAQEFTSGERAAGQTFARGERLGGQDFQQAEMDRQAQFKDYANSEQRKEFNTQMGLEMKKYNLDEIVSKFNMDMANKMWNKKDMMEFFANANGYDPRTGKFGTGVFTDAFK